MSFMADMQVWLSEQVRKKDFVPDGLKKQVWEVKDAIAHHEVQN